MTIPETIEKAIEGGWMSKEINGEKIHKLEIKNRYTPFISFIGRRNTLWRNVITIHFKDSELNFPLDAALLNPAFWQALGKAMGWNGKYAGNWRYLGLQAGGGLLKGDKTMEEWQYHWHRMIKALAEGKTLEEFVATL